MSPAFAPHFATLTTWVHDLDPFAIEIGGGMGLRWYGLSYLVGFVLGYFIIRRVVTVGRSPLTAKEVGDLVVALAIGIVVGGRLGYVFFYQPDLIADFSSRFPFWGVLAINKGGMASHGGMLGGIATCLIYAWKRRADVRPLHLMDLFAFGAPLGLFFGRIANFVNGELFGRGPTDVAWAVKFPQEMRDFPEVAQDAVNRAAAERLIPPGQDDLVQWLINQVQAGNTAVIDAIEPALTARHPSQLYAGVLEGLVVFAVLAIYYWKPRPAGRVGSLFCLTYGLVRIVNEFFRNPDTHLLDDEFAATREAVGIGISRGQWLSVLLIGLGVFGIWLSRNKPLMGGWLTGAEGTEPRRHEGTEGRKTGSPDRPDEDVKPQRR